MPSKKNQTKITILKKNMKNAINSFQKLYFNNPQDINNFLVTITNNFDYIQKILKKEGKFNRSSIHNIYNYIYLYKKV